MKLRKVRLHSGNELPFNEPNLNSQYYDLELVIISPGCPCLRIKPKGGTEEYWVPWVNIAGFSKMPEETTKEASGPRKS